MRRKIISNFISAALVLLLTMSVCSLPLSQTHYLHMMRRRSHPSSTSAKPPLLIYNSEDFLEDLNRKNEHHHAISNQEEDLLEDMKKHGVTKLIVDEEGGDGNLKVEEIIIEQNTQRNKFFGIDDHGSRRFDNDEDDLFIVKEEKTYEGFPKKVLRPRKEKGHRKYGHHTRHNKDPSTLHSSASETSGRKHDAGGGFKKKISEDIPGRKISSSEKSWMFSSGEDFLEVEQTTSDFFNLATTTTLIPVVVTKPSVTSPKFNKFTGMENNPLVLPVATEGNENEARLEDPLKIYGVPKELLPIMPGGGSRFEDVEREKLEKKKMSQTKHVGDDYIENSSSSSHEAESLYSSASLTSISIAFYCLVSFLHLGNLNL